MSPPLPGSDVIVPHWGRRRRWRRSRRTAPSMPACSGAGRASQNPITDGCIEATSATDGSAAASVRSRAQIGPVVSATLRHSPPRASGTATSRKPAPASRAKSSGSRPRLACRAGRSARHSPARSSTSRSAPPTWCPCMPSYARYECIHHRNSAPRQPSGRGHGAPDAVGADELSTEAEVSGFLGVRSLESPAVSPAARTPSGRLASRINGVRVEDRQRRGMQGRIASKITCGGGLVCVDDARRATGRDARRSRLTASGGPPRSARHIATIEADSTAAAAVRSTRTP